MKRLTSKFAVALLSMSLLTINAHADMVISKIYYAGTTQAGNNKNYTGGEEFIELHNNSATEYNIAGMYIGLIESESSTGAYLAKDRTNYEIKLKQVYQIPEDKDYIVAPWATVVIAACAIDHSQVAQNGPDLSKADFEFGGMAIDNDKVPNLNLIFSFNDKVKAVNITNGGDAGFVLISKKNGSKLTAADESTFVYANGKTSGNRYLPFNAYWAMDAVEILKTKLTDGKYVIDAERKRLSDIQDAGYVNADQKMNKDGYIAYRKTALNHNGDILLYDTQNSTLDFKISNTIGVKAYDSEADGVTEATVTLPESGYLPFNASQYFYTGNDLYIAYVNVKQGLVTFNSYNGNSVIANNGVYVLVGKPGEHTIYYTEAQRNLATSGANSWISDDNEFYTPGSYVYTGSSKRYPMKFVNEKGHVRFVRDMIANNPKSMKIDIETEGRYFINLTYLNEEENSIAWGGITPDEVATGISTPTTTRPTSTHTYNLQGMQVNGDQLASGIYIRDGKKIMIQ